jgi:hypothetical protein
MDQATVRPPLASSPCPLRARWVSSSGDSRSLVARRAKIAQISVLAAEPTAMPRSMSRRLHTGPVNSSSADWLRRVRV